jgi:hypothetical protein
MFEVLCLIEKLMVVLKFGEIGQILCQTIYKHFGGLINVLALSANSGLVSLEVSLGV